MSQLNETLMLALGTDAIAFVGGTTTAATAGSFAQNKPSGVQNGDIMIMGIYANASMTSNTPPSGWVVLSSDYSAASQPRYVLYWKIADGTDGSTITVTGQNTAKSGFIAAWRGASTVGTTGANTRVSSDTGTAASISPAAVGALIAIFHAGDVRTITTPPSGMVQVLFTSATTGSMAVYELIPSPAGATGSKSLVWNASAGLNSILLQIN